MARAQMDVEERLVEPAIIHHADLAYVKQCRWRPNIGNLNTHMLIFLPMRWLVGAVRSVIHKCT